MELNGVTGVRTNNKGTYTIEPDEGTYDPNITVEYGLLNGEYNSTNMSDTETVKNVLKYNGQDYYASYKGGSSTSGTVISSEMTEIKKMGKSAIQVFLAIDESESAYDEDVTYNNKTVKRIEAEVAAARELISNLLSQDQNIYIGIVTFSYDGWRACSLTKNEEKLNDVLDWLRKC